jgi:hypothetical protein
MGDPPRRVDRGAGRVVVYLQRLERQTWLKDRAIAAHEGKKVRRWTARTVRPILVALIGLARRFGHWRSTR